MDFKEKISQNSYLLLKTELKANAEVGRSIRRVALENKGLLRQKLRELKKAQGQKSREYILALTFLKGKLRKQVEPKTDFRYAPKESVKNILRSYAEYNYLKTEEFSKDFSRFFEKEKNNDID